MLHASPKNTTAPCSALLSHKHWWKEIKKTKQHTEKQQCGFFHPHERFNKWKHLCHAACGAFLGSMRRRFPARSLKKQTWQNNKVKNCTGETSWPKNSPLEAYNKIPRQDSVVCATNQTRNKPTSKGNTHKLTSSVRSSINTKIAAGVFHCYSVVVCMSSTSAPSSGHCTSCTWHQQARPAAH